MLWPTQSYGQEISYRGFLLSNIIITGATANMQQQQQCGDKRPEKGDMLWEEKKQTKLFSLSQPLSFIHTHTYQVAIWERIFFLTGQNLHAEYTWVIRHVITTAGSSPIHFH